MNIGYSQKADQYYDLDTGEPINAAAMEASPWEAAMVNMGEAFSNVGEKLGLMEPTGADLSQLNKMNPIASTVGQVAPYLATAPLGGGMAAQGALGAATGALFAEPGQEVQEGAFGAAGGVLGDMAGRVVSKLMGAKMAAPKLNQVAQEFSDTGGTLTPGMGYNSRFLKDIESSLASKPGGNIAYSGVAKANQKNVNRLAAEAVGLDPKVFPRMGDDALDAAYSGIGQQFDEVAELVPTTNIAADLADDIRTYVGRTGKLSRTFDKLGVKNYGEMGEAMDLDGRAMMSIRSRLVKQAKGASGEDALAYGDLIDDIDNVMQSAAPGNMKALYGDARGKYRALKAIEKSLGKQGDVSPAKLANRLQDWRGAEGAIGDLRTNVRAAGSQELGVPYGNSGTAQRSVNWTDYPPAPVYGGLGILERSLMQPSNPLTRYGGSVGAGLLANPEEQ